MYEYIPTRCYTGPRGYVRTVKMIADRTDGQTLYPILHTRWIVGGRKVSTRRGYSTRDFAATPPAERSSNRGHLHCTPTPKTAHVIHLPTHLPTTHPRLPWSGHTGRMDRKDTSFCFCVSLLPAVVPFNAEHFDATRGEGYTQIAGPSASRSKHRDHSHPGAPKS